MKFVLVMSLCVAGIVCMGLLTAHHGYRDWRRLRDQISEGERRVTLIEKDNQRLNRLVSLWEKPSRSFLEEQGRSELGWVRSGEKIYLESSGEPRKLARQGKAK